MAEPRTTEPRTTDALESDRAEAEPTTKVTPPEARRPEVSAAPLLEATEEPAAPAAPLVTQLTISAGGGGWLGVPTELAGALGIDLAMHLVNRFRISLLLLGATATGRAISDRGTVHLQAFVAALTAGVCGFERPSICGGVAGGARVVSAGVTKLNEASRLYRTTQTVVPLPAVGVFGRLAFPIIGGLEVSADLEVLVPLGAATFEIEGLTQARYVTPPVDLIAGVRLGWRFF